MYVTPALLVQAPSKQPLWCNQLLLVIAQPQVPVIWMLSECWDCPGSCQAADLVAVDDDAPCRPCPGCRRRRGGVDAVALDQPAIVVAVRADAKARVAAVVGTVADVVVADDDVGSAIEPVQQFSTLSMHFQRGQSVPPFMDCSTRASSLVEHADGTETGADRQAGRAVEVNIPDRPGPRGPEVLRGVPEAMSSSSTTSPIAAVTHTFFPCWRLSGDGCAAGGGLDGAARGCPRGGEKGQASGSAPRRRRRRRPRGLPRRQGRQQSVPR